MSERERGREGEREREREKREGGEYGSWLMKFNRLATYTS